jgi:hypothetical protein
VREGVALKEDISVWDLGTGGRMVMEVAEVTKRGGVRLGEETSEDALCVH